jgi:hypothetical protein
MALIVFVVIVIIIIILSRIGLVVCYGLPPLILIIIPLKTKCNLFYTRTRYRAVNTSHLGYKKLVR